MRQEARQQNYTAPSRADIFSVRNSSGETVSERIVIRSTPGPSRSSENTQPSRSLVSTHRPSGNINSSSTERTSRRPSNPGSHVSSLESIFGGPIDPKGNLLNLCDRPITCSSSNNRSEVVFGASNHSCYAVDFASSNLPLTSPRRVQEMYTRTMGHTDWVTDVAHLVDGRVVSSGMDGRLCLWELDRRTCRDIAQETPSVHEGSISKLFADPQSLAMLSCGYDGNGILWKINDNNSCSNTVLRSGGGGGNNSAPSPLVCGYLYSHCAFGASKGGYIYQWDKESGKLLTKLRGHPGCITFLQRGDESGNVLVTGGTDGFVKVWDLRQKEGSGLIFKSQIHISRARNSNSGDVSRMYSDLGKPSSSKDVVATTCAITCGQLLQSRGSSEMTHIVTGGSDGSIVALDVRRSFDVLCRIEGHRAPISCLTIVGQRAIFSGDEGGMLLCSDLESGRIAYGIGASQTGGVRVVNALDGKIIVGGDDGNVLSFEYY